MKFWITISICVVISILSILAIPIWILAIPGTENEYARSWSVAIFYILSWPILSMGVFCLTVFRHKIVSHDYSDTVLNMTFTLSILGSIAFILTVLDLL